MIGWNANAFHQYLNLAQGALAGMMLESGCVRLANQMLDCSASSIDPKYTAWAMLAIIGIKFVMNFSRDGLTGILKIQPPVSDNVKTVVVSSPAGATVEVTKK